MVTHVDVFSARPVLRVVRDLDGTRVVLEHTAMDLSRGSSDREAKLLHLLEKPDNRQSVLKGTGHAHILSLGGGESDDGLHLGSPKDWHPAVGQDVAMSGLSSSRVRGSNFLIPVASKVSIHMELQGLAAIRLHDEALVSSALEVTTNAFDSLAVWFLRSSGEPCALMHGIRYIAPCGFEVSQHPN